MVCIFFSIYGRFLQLVMFRLEVKEKESYKRHRHSCLVQMKSVQELDQFAIQELVVKNSTQRNDMAVQSLLCMYVI